MESTIITLNIGGKKIKTYKTTLEQCGVLQNQLERWDFNKNDELFIDQDPDIFIHFLNYLRNQNYKIPVNVEDNVKILMEYYCCNLIEKEKIFATYNGSFQDSNNIINISDFINIITLTITVRKNYSYPSIKYIILKNETNSITLNRQIISDVFIIKNYGTVLSEGGPITFKLIDQYKNMFYNYTTMVINLESGQLSVDILYKKFV